MNNSGPVTLVLGGTGRTGSLVARKLAGRGLRARTAARHGADVPFDWDNPATHGPALAGADRVYLVTPVLRVTYARLVADFLDLAEARGVRHVTYLSAYGSDHAPPQADIRAVELDLMNRPAFTSSVLRPASYRVMLNWLTGMIASGHGARPNDDVRRVTGSPPARFADFAQRNARAWALPAARP
jgi:uncharacterized protein YbjT (DUF2867 family)